MPNLVKMSLQETSNPQIIQHNRLLVGGQKINLRSRQLIYILARAISQDDPLSAIAINADEFLAYVNNSGKEKWSDIYALTRDIRKNLNDNPIRIKKGDNSKDYIDINWIESLGVSKGSIVARFTQSLAYYLAYKENESYTKLLWDIRAYKSGHTARFVDLFQRYHQKESGKVEIKFSYSVDELKFFLGVEDKYPKFSDMKRRILEQSRKELENNDLVPYWFEYDVERKGKKASKVNFTVYVRPKILMELVPSLKLLKKRPEDPMTLFDAAVERDLTETQKALIKALKAEKIKSDIAVGVISNLTEPQGRGYVQLIQYGVNRNLALLIVKQYCSFGEIIGFEHYYVEHCLSITETQRLDRIKAAKIGQSHKRVTPESKRGGLAKKVFEERIHFSSFMEKLSGIRREQFENEDDE